MATHLTQDGFGVFDLVAVLTHTRAQRGAKLLKLHGGNKGVNADLNLIA